MSWKTANKGLTLDFQNGKERYKTGCNFGAFIASYGCYVQKEVTESTVRSRQMSCDDE